MNWEYPLDWGAQPGQGIVKLVSAILGILQMSMGPWTGLMANLKKWVMYAWLGSIEKLIKQIIERDGKNKSSAVHKWHAPLSLCHQI